MLTGVDGIEMDVRLTKDKIVKTKSNYLISLKVVVYHDRDFKRLADDPRIVSELNYE